ncbi:hypothetical protein [Mesorhizobium sp. IMUNJ 23232]|uniref:hypothetical protein n=2 Tax=Mesorhizobium sp. IMUNJ 23232 TaxID=3376064 RepID=UPI00379B5690
MEFGDASATIERYRQALKHILLMLVGMAEMGFGRPGAGGQFTFFPQKGAAVENEAWAEKSKLSPALTPPLTLPRHLYRAILLLLRPAESAARRLIIAAAQGIVVTLPPFRPRKLKPKISDTVAAMRRLGLAVNLSREDFARYEAERKAAERRAARPRTANLSLLDALKYPFRIRRKYVPAHAVPRIRSLDDDTPRIPLPPPPSHDDPMNAAKLTLRLEALGRALDNLSGQAQRFARWKARNDAGLARDKAARDAAAAQGKPGPVRFRRFSPLRRGRPPGGRLPRFDPDAPKRKNIREVDEILAHANAMAFYALEPPRRDTS